MTPSEPELANFRRRLTLAYHAPSADILAAHAQGIVKLDLALTAGDLAVMEAGVAAMRERIASWYASEENEQGGMPEQE